MRLRPRGRLPGTVNHGTSWLFALRANGSVDGTEATPPETPTPVTVEPFRNQSRSAPRQRRLITDFAITDAELRAGSDPDLDCVQLFFRAMRSGEKMENPAGIYPLRSRMFEGSPIDESALLGLQNLPHDINVDVRAAAGPRIVVQDGPNVVAASYKGGGIKVTPELVQSTIYPGDPAEADASQYVRVECGIWDASKTPMAGTGLTFFDIY